jgi:Fe-S cluster biogenesis protein NfuA
MDTPKANGKKKGAGITAPVLVPQPHGGALLSGGIPGNKGGGRYKEETIEALGSLVRKHGPDLIRDIMTGTVKYNFVGTCSHCGEESEGPTTLSDALEAVSKQIPSPDTRLRSVVDAAKIAWGEKTSIEMVSPDVVSRVQATADVLLRMLGKDHEATKAVSLIWR